MTRQSLIVTTVSFGIVAIVWSRGLEWFAQPEPGWTSVRVQGQKVPPKFRSHASKRIAVSATSPEQQEWLKDLSRIQRESDPERRTLYVAALVARTAEPDRMLEWLLAEGQGETGQETGIRMLRQWAEKDPKAAAEWFQNATIGGQLREEAVQQVAIAWSAKSMEEAVRWSEGLAAEGERQKAMMQVAYEASRSAPVEALHLAGKLPLSTERDALIEHAVAEWSASAPALAVQWVDSMSMGDVKDRALVAAISMWSESDPASAAEAAIGSLPAGRALDDALTGIVQRWAQKEPEKAEAWVRRFPEGALRDQALESIANLGAQKTESGGEP